MRFSHTRHRFFFLALIAMLIALGSGSAIRADFTLDFFPGGTFTGTQPGAGSGPGGAIFQMTFADTAGGVNVTLQSFLAPGENLAANDAIYFNFNPAKSALLGSLNFVLTSSTGPGPTPAGTFNQGEDAFKADGDGAYDILVTYPGGGGAMQMVGGDTQIYFVAGVSSSDFNFGSTPQPGNGTNFTAALHVQNTPNGGSGSAFVGNGGPNNNITPAPPSVVLLGIGIALFGCVTWSRRRSLGVAA
jgi:hypothetical protein